MGQKPTDADDVENGLESHWAVPVGLLFWVVGGVVELATDWAVFGFRVSTGLGIWGVVLIGGHVGMRIRRRWPDLDSPRDR